MLLAIANLCVQQAYAQIDELPLELENTLYDNWLVQDEATGQLVPSAGRSGNKAVHQWVKVNPEEPFLISFTAPEALSLFLNNRLIFTANTAGTYTVNLSDFSEKVPPVKGKYLLTVWHPEQQPAVASFQNVQQKPQVDKQDVQGQTSIKVREYVSQNIYIILLLIIGLIYGYLRTNYPADFSSVFNPGTFLRSSALEEGWLAKPISSWTGILFILAFSISLALLVVALHTNIHHIRLFNQLLPVSGADITSKVIFYTLLIFFIILLKYLFIKVMSFIFGLEQVADLQYREFVRTLLFLGIFLPVIMLLYLVLHVSASGIILTISNVAVSLLLIITTIRVSTTVNTKTTILNLHLFSYLCATEVIPLAIMLKLIVYNF